MLNFVIQVIICIICLYGIFSIIQDYINFNTYKKIEKNIKLIMTVKNVEDGIEQYIRELTFGGNFFNNLIVIDMESTDETVHILHKLEKETYNMKVINKEEGKEYLKQIL